MAGLGKMSARSSKSLPAAPSPACMPSLDIRPTVAILGNGLCRCQVAQDSLGQARVQPEALQRGDDAVAPERRVEPRHSRIGVKAGGQYRRHHVQVGGGAPNQRVELPIPCLNRAELRYLRIQLRPGVRARAFEYQEAWTRD